MEPLKNIVEKKLSKLGREREKYIRNLIIIKEQIVKYAGSENIRVIRLQENVLTVATNSPHLSDLLRKKNDEICSEINKELIDEEINRITIFPD